MVSIVHMLYTYIEFYSCNVSCLQEKKNMYVYVYNTAKVLQQLKGERTSMET